MRNPVLFKEPLWGPMSFGSVFIMCFAFYLSSVKTPHRRLFSINLFRFCVITGRTFFHKF